MEEARVEIRNLRREAADAIKNEERDGELGTDEAHRELELLQKVTDRHIAEVDKRRAAPRSRRSWRSSGPRTAGPPDRRAADRPRAGAAVRRRTGRRRRAAPAVAAEPRSSRATSRSSWTATGAGPARAASPSWRATPPASRRSAGSLRHVVRRGVPILSLYAFSRENWARSDEEVTGLFGLLEQAIRSETDELARQGVRVRLLGRLDELPDETRAVDREAPGGHGRRRPAAAQHRVQLRRPDRAGRCRSRRIVASGVPADEIDEAAIAGRAVHRRPARSGPRHPHRRRAAPQQLPDLAVAYAEF